MKVSECCLIKPEYCNENDTVMDVARKLKEKSLRKLIVLNDKKEPVGVITTTDIAFKIVAEGIDVNKAKVKEFMSTPIVTIDAEDDVMKANLKITDLGVYSIPVVSDNKLKGLITLNELIKNSLKGMRKEKK